MKKDKVFHAIEYVYSNLVRVLFYFRSRLSSAKFAVFCFFVMLTLTIICTPLNNVLREDAFTYLVKAFEITQGNWAPDHETSIGWPVFVSFFLRGLGVSSFFQGMVVLRLLSVLVVCLAVFPLSALTNTLIGRRAGKIALISFALSPALIRIGGRGYTESLFILLVISAIYYLSDPNVKALNLVLGTVLASLSYYVRPNGLFLSAVIVLYALFLIRNKRIKWQFIVLLPLVFILVSLPHQYQRYLAFGSAFDYGQNSKYLVDTYAQVWSHDTFAPSLLDYLLTHNIQDYLKKFVYSGLLKIMKFTYDLLGEVWLVLFVLGALKYLLIDRVRDFVIISVLFFVFFAGFAPVFHIYGSPRHLYVLLPFFYLISSRCLVDLLGKRRGNEILVLSFVLLVLTNSAIALSPTIVNRIRDGIEISSPKVQDEWALWSAENLNGRIGIIEGGELIIMSLIDKEMRDDFGRLDTHGSLSISFVRPGSYNELEEAMEDFERMRLKYLLLDTYNIARRPYLEEVYSNEWSDHFILVKSFRSEPEDKWVISDMDVFRVVY